MKKYLNGYAVKQDILKEIENISKSYYIYRDQNGNEVVSQWDEVIFFGKKIFPDIKNKNLFNISLIEYIDFNTKRSISGYSLNINKDNKLVEQIIDLCVKYKDLWAYDFEKDLSYFLHLSVPYEIKNKINDKSFIFSKKENEMFTYKVGIRNKKEDEYVVYYFDNTRISEFEKIYDLTTKNNKTLYIGIDDVLYEIHPLKLYNNTSITIDELPISGNYDFEIIKGLIIN